MLKLLPLMFVSLGVAVAAWAKESNEWLGVSLETPCLGIQ